MCMIQRGVPLSMSRICPEYVDAHPSDLLTVGDVRFREEPDEEEEEEEEEEDDENKDEGDREEGNEDNDQNGGYSV